MNKLVFCCLLAVAAAAPQYNIATPAPAPTYNARAPSYSAPVVAILRDDRQGPDAYGNFNFAFETADGISRQEQGAPQGDTGAVATRGGWSFTFPDGTPGVFNFVADGSGYRVESDLLPTPPPMPAHALEQIEKARLEDEAAAASNRYSNPAPAPSNQYNVPAPAPAPVNQYSAPAPAPAPVNQYSASSNQNIFPSFPAPQQNYIFSQ